MADVAVCGLFQLELLGLQLKCGEAAAAAQEHVVVTEVGPEALEPIQEKLLSILHQVLL
jgi:hypothetical protein